MTNPFGSPPSVMVLLVRERDLSAAEVCHQPSNQVVLKSRVVDHLYEDVV